MMSSGKPREWACNVKRWHTHIWRTPLTNQDDHFSERYLAYVLSPILIGTLTFIAMYYLGISQFPGYYRTEVLYHNRYALETALNFGIWLYVFEEWAIRMLWPWAHRHRHTIGGACLLWSGGFLVALVVQFTLVYQRIDIYAPKITHFFDLYPLQRPSVLLRLAVFAAIWFIALNCRVIYGLLLHQFKRRRPQIARASENDRYHQRMARHDTSPIPSAHPGNPAVNGPVHISNGKIVTVVQPDKLINITSEGHYCRFTLKSEDKQNEIFTRMALKDVIAKLPNDDFIQIHRSHVVNKQFIEKLKKNGRTYSLYLDGAATPLPISRHRWPAIRDRIDPACHMV